MSECFAFRFYEPGESKRQSLCLFFATKWSEDAASRGLKKDVQENLVPKNVFAIVFSDYLSTGFSGTDTLFQTEFESYVGESQTQFVKVCVNADGELLCENGILDTKLRESLLEAGTHALFKKHQGVIESSPSYHFLKPSGAHCDKFIRASNLLVSSISVAFLAIPLLPHIRDGLKRVYVDTSSIAFLVAMALQLSKKFCGSLPAIESFESYSAFKQDFDFVEDTDSLVFISATTSGSLAASLLSETTFSINQVITLFHTGLPEKQKGIFDVGDAIPNGISSFKERECPFCKRGAKLIQISGDQFLPETPKHELLVIKKVNFSEKREKFFGEFATRQVLEWEKPASSIQDEKEHFFIDVVEILKAPPKTFQEDLNKNVKRYLTRDLQKVICFDDEGSKALGERIKQYLGDAAAKELGWVTLSELEESDVDGSASIMVVAGAITSGRSLLSVSRKLRGIDPSATITYFVGFSKLPTEESFEQLHKDLRQGGHEFVVLRKTPMPRVKEHVKTSWRWEVEKLQEYGGDDPLMGSEEVLPARLNTRLQKLRSGNLTRNELFLSDPKGNPLKLRRTFAFWSDLRFDQEGSTGSQADVYWTVQSVLHDLRLASDDKGLATTYHHTLISPASFDRFNDGVIQAALLRSASPVELNYSVDEAYSRQMTDVISSVLRNWNNSQGEASLEFLVALWTGRLQLADTNAREIANLANTDMPEEMQFLLKQIAKAFSK